MVMRPTDGNGARSMNALELLRRDPRLALLAGDVDLDEELEPRRASCFSSSRSALSLPTEWMQRTSGAITLTLRDWSWPMKSHVKCGVRRLLALELLRAVLGDGRDAGLHERGEVLELDVLDGGDDLHVLGLTGPRGLRHRAISSLHRLEVRRGRPPRLAPRDARLAAGPPAVAPVGEEERRVAAHRAQPAVLDGLHAGGEQPLAGDRGQVDGAGPPAGSRPSAARTSSPTS